MVRIIFILNAVIMLLISCNHHQEEYRLLVIDNGKLIIHDIFGNSLTLTGGVKDSLLTAFNNTILFDNRDAWAEIKKEYTADIPPAPPPPEGFEEEATQEEIDLSDYGEYYYVVLISINTYDKETLINSRKGELTDEGLIVVPIITYPMGILINENKSKILSLHIKSSILQE